MSGEIRGARLDDTLDDLDKMAKGEVRAISDIRAVGEDGAWTVRSLRAENARLREELEQEQARSRALVVYYEDLDAEQDAKIASPRAALRGDEAEERV